AANECKAHGPIIARRRRRERAADPAHVSRLIDEAIPIFACGPETRCKEAAGPIGGWAHFHIAARDDVCEGFIAGDLHHEPMRARACIRGAARPQDHAVRCGIARRYALRVEVSSFSAGPGAFVRTASTESESRAYSGGLHEQRSARFLLAH